MANGDERPSTQLADAIGIGFQTIIDSLRTDVREDVNALRTDVREDIREVKVELGKVDVRVSETRTYLESFAKGHGAEHEQEAEERRRDHGLFYDFIRKAELDAARRDGALGVVRYSIELLSKHAGRIIAILTTLGILGGLASGNIAIGLGQGH